MKLVRLTGLVVALALVTSLVLVSAASAREPLFVPGSGTLTALTGTAKLTASSGTDSIECKESKSPGTIESPHLIKLAIHFLKCEGTENGGATKCSVKSVGAPAENLIETETLHAVIGLILPHIPAVLILPIAGSTFVTLVGPCLLTTKVTGSVTAEITSETEKLLPTAALNLGSSVSKHFISSLGNILVIAKLTAFAAEATETAESTIDWGQLTEVT